MSSKASGKPQSVKGQAHDATSPSAVLSMLKNLHKYSKDRWTNREDALWKKFLENWRDEELEALRSRGLDDQKAEKLVERVWVSRDPKSGALRTVRSIPSDLALFVPAIRVFRDGEFVIHPQVLGYLECHPVLAVPSGGVLAAGDERPRILQAIDAIEESLGLGHVGLGFIPPAVPEDGGADRRIVDCGAAAHQLLLLLDTEYREGASDDDLDWLLVGREREQFWRLLDAAFLLGECMERYQVLDQRGAEEAMLRRITVPPGKGGRIERAVIKMIDDYALEHSLPPTPGKLLKWLGGTVPHDSTKALLVDHPLWTTEMKPITWKRFQDLVKKAKQKMKRSGNAHP